MSGIFFQIKFEYFLNTALRSSDTSNPNFLGTYNLTGLPNVLHEKSSVNNKL